MIATAVIMAAGKGTRFGNRTADMPKGFIEFKGKPMIERSIENLLGAGIRRIIIGTGYHREWYDRLAGKYPQVETVFSKEYADTNSMETLYVCRYAIGEEDFLLLESDIVYEPRAISGLLESDYPDIMLASDVTKFQDQYYIGVDADMSLCRCAVNKEVIEAECGEVFGELVGIHRISNEFFKEMVGDYEHNRTRYLKRGYEFELEDIATSVSSIGKHHASQRRLHVLKLSNLQWYEIDDVNDLEFAQTHILIDQS